MLQKTVNALKKINLMHNLVARVQFVTQAEVGYIARIRCTETGQNSLFLKSNVGVQLFDLQNKIF